MNRFVVGFVIAAALAACTRNTIDRPKAVVRDSAGVRIVENAAPQWTAETTWRLAEVPLVDIGGSETNPNEQFTRVAGLTRLSDGRIVVANSSRPPEIRFYDADGRHQQSIGGAGRGPGELRNIYWMHVVEPDTIVAYDPGNQRLTFFDVTGDLLGTESTSSDQTTRNPLRGYLLWAPLGDGSYLRIRNQLYEATKRGVHRDSMVWTRGRPDGSDLDTIGRFPGYEYYAQSLAPARESATLTFGLRSVVLGHERSFYVAAGDEFRIDRYTLDGALEMSFRRVFQRRRVTSADVEALRQRELDVPRSDASRRRVEQRYRDYPHAEEMPAHGSRMLVDLQHNLWVEEYMGPRDSIPRYTVFAGDGDFLGNVAMPARFEPRHIGSDYVLGVWRDADDVEHVQLYDLVKPEG